MSMRPEWGLSVFVAILYGVLATTMVVLDVGNSDYEELSALSNGDFIEFNGATYVVETWEPPVTIVVRDQLLRKRRLSTLLLIEGQAHATPKCQLGWQETANRFYLQ